MVASILRRIAHLLGLMPAAKEWPASAADPAPLSMPPEHAPPKRPASTSRKSRPRVSPLAMTRAPRIAQLPRLLPALASRLAAASAQRRPKAASPAPKCRPRHRHVWLETRPSSPRRGAAARLADLIAGPGETALAAAA